MQVQCFSNGQCLTLDAAAMLGAGGEADAQRLEVVVGVAQRVDLQPAAVAGAGVDLADHQGPAEGVEHGPLEAPRRDAQRLVGRRRRLGLDAGDEDLFQYLIHGHRS